MNLDRLQQKRLDKITRAYLNDEISEEVLEEVLEAIMRNEPPFYAKYILMSADVFTYPDDKIMYMGQKLERDGMLYRKI